MAGQAVSPVPNDFALNETPAPAGLFGPGSRETGRAVLASSFGNFMEMFDFVVFGLLARQISGNFFPGHDGSLSLLAALSTYGVGFLTRPLGGMILGSYGDRHGRRATLILTSGLMAITTACIALIPPYSRIGIFAPVLLISCRLIQGIAAGGEWGGAAVFLVEHAPVERRGLFGSLQQLGVGAGNIMGASIIALLSFALSPLQMEQWGWRIPFALGFALFPLGLYVRSRVCETPVYTSSLAEGASEISPLSTLFRTHRAALLRGFGASALCIVASQTTNIFLPAFATSSLSMAGAPVFLSSMLAALVFSLGIPFAGAASDKFGRQPVVLTGAIALILLLPFALYRLYLTPSFGTLITTQMIFAACLTCLSGPLCAYLCEIFTTDIRLSGLSTSYSLAVTLFGGLTPSVDLFLTQKLHSLLAVMVAVGIASLLTIISMLSVRNRHPRSFGRTSGEQGKKDT
ncbi:MFS transporter [Acetobacter musti]|uniref:MFS transporter n=1 Tax=Acetobacter musti TaxID=864732 RepID=A0ABX0JMD0_9PROT|nr:MFS transporter [Acetobacter musti]NHN84150.1 MFS transporter [Acetobacter musti]